ncbi:MAG: type II toxin-antitoxin system death-on-curing family toxin [Deltaproteobacteria bacterium]|nr:type II toxin-antitoxin system death-on-curing family toxin [Deltaproteobacteria bacterium]
MTRALSVPEVLRVHALLMEQAGSSAAVRDLAGRGSAGAQPNVPFGGVDLYPEPMDEAVARGFALIRNHPFVDGNKRIGHASMEIMLALNGVSLEAPMDDAEHGILGVASGVLGREQLSAFVRTWAKPSGSRRGGENKLCARKRSRTSLRHDPDPRPPARPHSGEGRHTSCCW